MTLYSLIASSLAGPGAPANSVGVDGAIYLDLNSGLFYGPKTAGAWPTNPIGTTVTVSSPVSDTGQTSQCRAGRQLAASDFTSLGLSAPRGLWNLSDLTDASGNGRTLTNKNAVTFTTGINGAAATAAQFRGASGTPANDPVLYIPDDASGTLPGAAFRILTGSWGCWFRTAKRGIEQFLLSKWNGTGNQRAYLIGVSASNVAEMLVSGDGAAVAQYGVQPGVSDVCDDRWHFLVATSDATTLRLYVDGVLEATAAFPYPLFGSSAPLNIGAIAADSGNPAGGPHYGRVDEAFVSADVLTEDQVRLLYAARLVHTLGAQPKTVSLNVRRQRKGAALATTDFSTQPVRLHNFTAGALTDQGSNSSTGTPKTLTNAYTSLIVPVAGADGTLGNAFGFSGAHQGLSAHDGLSLPAAEQLPSGLNARSYGCWFKTASTAIQAFLGWGTLNSADARLITNAGAIVGYSGSDAITSSYVADGQWHFAVEVEDNTAGDGIKRKLYVDGRLVGGSTLMNTLTLAGASRFRVGANPDGTAPFTGQIDTAFVCAYAMSFEEITRLYNKGGQPLSSSPKNAGDHMEGIDSGSLLIVADTLEGQHYVDWTVA